FAGDGSRLYRTGDRVRWLADGRLEFLGRVDDQVKVHGFRIEPAEIEQALVGHQAVSAVVVVARGEDADRRLVAYLVPADPAEGIPSVRELRAYAAERLPGHLIPAVYVELASLPVNRNGKIDRAALPEPESARPELADAFVSPRTPTEVLLAEVWSE